MIREVKINSKNYGKVTLYLELHKNYFHNGYFVSKKIRGKNVCGFVDKDGTEIIPLSEMELVEAFSTDDNKDTCLGFKMPDTDYLKYYHVKRKDGKSRVVMETNPYDDVPIALVQVKENDSYWIMQALKDDPEYAAYYVKDAKIKTTFFDELSFDVDENPYHTMYFCKYIYSDLYEEDEIPRRIIHTSVCGFLDQDGNISSQVYETEAGLLYNSYRFNRSTLTKDFNDFIRVLKNNYLREYNKKDEIITDMITYLFNNPDLSEKPTNYSDKAKIIQFKGK